MSKFEYWKAKNGQWYFRLRAANGKVVCQSEGYTRKHSCLKGMRAIRDALYFAVIVEAEA